MFAFEKNTATIINIIFHPICISTYAIAMFLYANLFFANIINEKVKLFILIFTFCVSTIVPFLLYLAFKKTGIYTVTDKNKKIWTGIFAFLMAIVFWTISRFFLTINLSWLIMNFYLWNSLYVLILGLVSFFVKINFYAIGIGELIGLYIWFMRVGFSFNISLLFILIIFFGIIGWAQIITKKTLAINYCLETVISILFIFIIFGLHY